MPDNKANVGQADRIRVSAKQPHEVKYLVEKFGLSRETVERVIEQFGPMRENVEAQLERMKNGANN